MDADSPVAKAAIENALNDPNVELDPDKDIIHYFTPMGDCRLIVKWRLRRIPEKSLTELLNSDA